MALEEFERALEADRSNRHKRKRDRSRSRDRDDESRRRKHDPHRRHHHHHHHRSRREESRDRHERSDTGDRSHRTERARDERQHHHRHKSRRSKSPFETTQDADSEANGQLQELPGNASKPQSSRLAWMEAPASTDIHYIQRQQKEEPQSTFVPSSTGPKLGGEHSKQLTQESNVPDRTEDIPAQHEVDYTFGDSGSSWRMTRLKSTYSQAQESGKSLDEVALDRYGDLRAFDDAREEERELNRRKTLGSGYVGLDKPSGELYQDRKLESGFTREDTHRSAAAEESEDEFEKAQDEASAEKPPVKEAVALDQTALNRLKAQLMRAKLSKAPNYDQLQAEYDSAMAVSSRDKGSGVVVLNKMESRSLAGGRAGEVKTLDSTKRGRERGHVEENEDMSIEDMVRQERRTKWTNDGKTFADRIAKDAKFDNDLDYLDENASKLSKSVQKSDINLRNTAVSEYQKMKRILDTCPMCAHEDTGTPPLAPVVSLATRTFLTLPTNPEITPYGYCASIAPIQHRINLLECDDDEWEEIRNFMKSLTRFYYSLKPSRHVIFYENAAHEGRKRHASLEAVPLPMKFADTASQFFKEAILSSDEEWTQHKKIIDTMRKAEDGAGKHAFRKSMVSELPYFHVWFRIDGGYGHVVEDPRRWPKGDLFAREIIGGMLDVGPDVIKRQGRWRKGDSEMETRVKEFRQRWHKYDWTTALLDAS